MKTIDIKVFLTDRFETPKIWRLEVPAMPPMDAADLVSRISNCPPEFLSDAEREILEKFPRTKLRSVSVGDIIMISDAERPDMRHVATVERLGFKFH